MKEEEDYIPRFGDVFEWDVLSDGDRKARWICISTRNSYDWTGLWVGEGMRPVGTISSFKGSRDALVEE